METKETPLGVRLSDIERNILALVDQGYRVTDISRKLGVSKSTVSKKLRKLLNYGFVSKSNGLYKITDKGRFYLDVSSFSMGSMVRLRFEGLRVVFGRVFLRGGWRGFLGGGRGTGLRNVDQVVLDGPEGTRVYVTLGRPRVSVMVLFPRVEFSRYRFFSEFLAWFNYVLWRVVGWLGENGVVVDPGSLRVVSQETASKQVDEVDSVVEERRHTVVFDRAALGPVGEFGEAKAWIDRSHGSLEVESNDFRYVEKLIMMPELVHELYTRILPSFMESLKTYDAKVEAHLELISRMSQAMESMDRTLEAIRSSLEENRRPGFLDRIKSWFRRLGL